MPFTVNFVRHHALTRRLPPYAPVTPRIYDNTTDVCPPILTTHTSPPSPNPLDFEAFTPYVRTYTRTRARTHVCYAHARTRTYTQAPHARYASPFALFPTVHACLLPLDVGE